MFGFLARAQHALGVRNLLKPTLKLSLASSLSGFPFSSFVVSFFPYREGSLWARNVGVSFGRSITDFR